MTFLVDGTLGGTFPSWTTATRPASPAVGQMGYNTTTGQFDAYTSNGWTSVATSGNAPVSGPAFSATPSTNQTISASTFTKVQVNTEEFDTNSNYDTTNYRFTPTVAGYYQFTGGATFTTTQTSELLMTLFKNGARFKSIFDMEAVSWSGFGSVLVYANGTTDYFELYAYTASVGTKTIGANTRDTYFQACLVRSA
jgi:hypothetical protein